MQSRSWEVGYELKVLYEGDVGVLQAKMALNRKLDIFLMIAKTTILTSHQI